MLLAQSGLTTKWRREFFPPPNECTNPSPKGEYRPPVNMTPCPEHVMKEENDIKSQCGPRTLLAPTNIYEQLTHSSLKTSHALFWSPAGPRRLALKDLSGCFTLAAAGLLLAAMVLLGELLVGRITTKASSKIDNNDKTENLEQTSRKTKNKVTLK